MADGKRITCYTDEDGCPILSDEVLEFYRFECECAGWYSKNNTYVVECKTIILNKEELEEYISKIKK